MELELGSEVVFKKARVIGIHGRKMFETWAQMENLLASEKLEVLPSITHVLPLAEWKEVIEMASSEMASKVVFEP